MFLHQLAGAVAWRSRSIFRGYFTPDDRSSCGVPPEYFTGISLRLTGVTAWHLPGIFRCSFTPAIRSFRAAPPEYFTNVLTSDGISVTWISGIF